MAKQRSGQDANFEFYIRFSETETVNIADLNEKERDAVRKMLNETALRAAGYIPQITKKTEE